MADHDRKGNLASWKFRLEDTINGDPEAPKAGLKVMRVYLNSLTDDNQHPYAAMTVLMAKTGLSEATIKRARDGLIALGYMVETGRSSDGRMAGAVMYELRNPREEYVKKLVDDKLQSFRDEARAQMRAARAEREIRDDVPLKNEPHIADPSRVLSPQKMNPMSPQNLNPMSPQKMNPKYRVISGEHTVGAAVNAAPSAGQDSSYAGPLSADAERSHPANEKTTSLVLELLAECLRNPDRLSPVDRAELYGIHGIYRESEQLSEAEIERLRALHEQIYPPTADEAEDAIWPERTETTERKETRR